MAQLKGAQVTWLGHVTFKVTTPQNKVILINAWIEGNPKSPAEASYLDKVDVILVTHEYCDHINHNMTLWVESSCLLNSVRACNLVQKLYHSDRVTQLFLLSITDLQKAVVEMYIVSIYDMA
jgi:L-ascorbate metabolism protein UlaG (beta-lactamase superfamily)